MAQAVFSLDDALRALKDAVSNDSSHSSLFHAAKGRADWTVVADSGFSIHLIKTGYTGPAPPGQPPRLPNISFTVSFPNSGTNLKLYPFISYPSSDAAVNKAAFVRCIDYFLNNPNTSTYTAKAT